MITLEIDLGKLKHAIILSPKGAKCLVIPIDENKIEVYENKFKLKIVGFEFDDKSNKEYKDTHILKQSFKKEDLAKLSDDEKKALPILGNARVSSSGSHGEPKPNSATPDEVANSINDLPF